MNIKLKESGFTRAGFVAGLGRGIIEEVLEMRMLIGLLLAILSGSAVISQETPRLPSIDQLMAGSDIFACALKGDIGLIGFKRMGDGKYKGLGEFSGSLIKKEGQTYIAIQDSDVFYIEEKKGTAIIGGVSADLKCRKVTNVFRGIIVDLVENR